MMRNLESSWRTTQWIALLSISHTGRRVFSAASLNKAIKVGRIRLCFSVGHDTMQVCLLAPEVSFSNLLKVCPGTSLDIFAENHQVRILCLQFPIMLWYQSSYYLLKSRRKAGMSTFRWYRAFIGRNLSNFFFFSLLICQWKAVIAMAKGLWEHPIWAVS